MSNTATNNILLALKLTTKDFKTEMQGALTLLTNFEKAVELEDSLIEFIYGSDIDVEGLKKEDVKTYIRYLADRRLLQLGLKPIYKQKDNPLTWLDWVVSGDSFKNFFEGTVTDYNADGMKGDWGW